MELKSIRQQKLEDLQKQQHAAQAQDFINQQLENVKKTVLQRWLTTEARERLAMVKAAKPALAQQVETSICELAQAGAFQEPINEMRLKEILNQVSEEKKNFRIIK
jgi:programmed cell death protein 5